MSNIDWDFISEREGLRLTGYVPDPDGSKSGVTIATGFDLGARNESDLVGLPKTLIEKLKPYLGIKGAEAQGVAKNLKITSSQAAKIDEFSKKKATDALKAKWMNATGESFDDLPNNKATVVASVAFQYGDLESETPNFWRQVTNNDWNAALNNLRDFEDKYPTRRNLEADYLESGMSEEELAAKKKFEDELARDVQYGIQEAMISGEEGGLGSAPTRDIASEIIQERQPSEIKMDDSSVDGIITERKDQSVQLDQSDVDGILTERQQQAVGVDQATVPIMTERQQPPVAMASDDMALPIIEEVKSPQIDLTTPVPIGSDAPAAQKANSRLPNLAEFADGYTSLYGDPGERYGESIRAQRDTNPEVYDYFVLSDDNRKLWERSFRQLNFTGALEKVLSAEHYPTDPNYDPFKDKLLLRKIGGADGLWRFRFSGSHAESMNIYKRMQEDAEDMFYLQNSFSQGHQLVASLATPTIFAPLAPIKILSAANRTRRFVGGTAYTFALTAPEELLISSQSYERDASHSALALTAISLVGGGLATAFGKKAVRPVVSAGPEGGQTYRSAGASVSPEKAREAAYAQMKEEALEETGIGIEKLGWNPVLRMMKSPNPYVRGLATRMVDVGGMMQKKVRSQEAKMDQSIETEFNASYRVMLGDAVRAIDEAFLSYRGVDIPRTDSAAAISKMKEGLGDAVRGSNYLSETQFRIRVGMAMRRGDADYVGDEASAYVTQAARAARDVFNRLKEDAVRVRLYELQLMEDINRLRALGPEGAQELAKMEEMLAKLQAEGVTPNTAASYLPRVPRVDKIMDNQEKFLSIIQKHGMEDLKMSPSQARSYAKEVMDTYTKQRPYYDAEGATDSLDYVKRASSVHARTLLIQDELIEEFLESDIEVLLRHHVKTLGMDIKITEAFGDVNMQRVIDDIVSEYNFLMGKVSSGIDKVVTGQPISIRMHRGSQGGGKVAFTNNALGDGLYFATNAKTASNFGKKVEQVDLNLRKPLKISSDEELLNILRSDGVSVDDLLKAKKEYDDFMLFMIDLRKTKPKGKAGTDDWFKRFDQNYNTIAGRYATARRKQMLNIRTWAELNGYDSIVINFGQDNFDQVTKGKLTPFKIVDEYQNISSKGGKHQILEESFSHDQVLVFSDDFDSFGRVTATRSAEEIASLEKSMADDLRDVRGLRDRLRGTYGASKDPHALSSRVVRAMKSINVLAGMGSAMVSSVPDVARIVMVEGFNSAYRRGFATLFDEQAKLIKNMAADEVRKAGVGLDAALGLRAHAMSDIGDLFGSRYGFERGLNKATGMFFLFNGLNLWNQLLKEMAGNVTMLRMTEAIMKPWNKLSAADKEKLLKNGIDQQDHMRMQKLINDHGEQINGEWLPNTDAWDPTMRQTFRNALNQNVERIIITPGAGDRALWTSTEFGSLLTQFKSYGQGAMIRMATSGLQEKDGAFWQGAFMIVGLAGIINEIKRAQYGIDSEEDFDQKLINAIDRSGILGWAMDVNNAIEKISDHNFGMRAMLTDQQPYNMPLGAKAGALFGPAASNTMTAASVMRDVVTFNADQNTMGDLRFIFPTGNLFYMDPIYDGVFGE